MVGRPGVEHVQSVCYWLFPDYVFKERTGFLKIPGTDRFAQYGNVNGMNKGRRLWKGLKKLLRFCVFALAD